MYVSSLIVGLAGHSVGTTRRLQAAPASRESPAVDVCAHVNILSSFVVGKNDDSFCNAWRLPSLAWHKFRVNKIKLFIGKDLQIMIPNTKGNLFLNTCTSLDEQHS